MQQREDKNTAGCRPFLGKTNTGTTITRKVAIVSVVSEKKIDLHILLHPLPTDVVLPNKLIYNDKILNPTQTFER